MDERKDGHRPSSSRVVCSLLAYSSSWLIDVCTVLCVEMMMRDGCEMSDTC